MSKDYSDYSFMEFGGDLITVAENKGDTALFIMKNRDYIATPDGLTATSTALEMLEACIENDEYDRCDIAAFKDAEKLLHPIWMYERSKQ